MASHLMGSERFPSRKYIDTQPSKTKEQLENTEQPTLMERSCPL
ncbi:hypothetical protein ACVT98_18345 [Vibrio campbellii]